jgi:hypothetical protein
MKKSASYVRVLTLCVVACAVGVWGLSATTTQALNSCSLTHPSSIVSFSQGLQSNGSSVDEQISDPSILLDKNTPEGSALALGIGGAITLHFPTPLANYPSAGLPSITRPTNTASCLNAPVRATISGSIDGVSFTQLGITCEGGSFSLGAFPWVSHIRITDATDPSDPAFATQPSAGFTLASLSGQSCLKNSLCATTSSLDSTVAEPTTSYPFSLGALGDDWTFDHEASFEEYGNGSARLTGLVRRESAPSEVFQIILSFTGRTDAAPAGSPIRILKPSAYSDQGGPIDPATWYYYKTIAGVFLGAETSSGQNYSILNTIHALQIGDGADGRSALRGGFVEFLFGSNLMQSEGSLAFTLQSCSSPLPTPTPPTDPDQLENEKALCSSDDQTATLAALDQSLLSRRESVMKALRALVRDNPSRANRAFRNRALASTRDLATSAWQIIWKHPWKILLCSPSALCSPTSLRPSQEAILSAIQTLDAYVTEALQIAAKRATRQKTRSMLRQQLAKHKQHSLDAPQLLQSLPTETYACRSR